MRTLTIFALFLHAVLASRIHIYGTDDAPLPYSPEAILNKPSSLIFQSSASPSLYRAAVAPAGLKGDILKTNPAYQDLAKVLYSDLELSALYADMTKFENYKIFDIPLTAGDKTIVPSITKVANHAIPPWPLIFITNPKEFEEFEIKNLKHFGHVDLQK